VVTAEATQPERDRNDQRPTAGTRSQNQEMYMDRLFDLLTDKKRVVQWTGRDGEDAARRYVDGHRDVTIVAWRLPRVAEVVVVHPSQIVG
jgi:hypothetical protein